MLCIAPFHSGPTAAPSARELSLTSQLTKLQETIEQRTKIEIGDIIRIRGYIRTYREEREIHATAYCKHKIFLPHCLLFWVYVQLTPVWLKIKLLKSLDKNI